MVVVEKELQINSNLSSFLGGGLGVGTIFALHPGPYLAMRTATQPPKAVRCGSNTLLYYFIKQMSSTPLSPTISNQPALLMFSLQSASGLPISTAT